jgi:very-short-patch-repair endonuclease
MDSTARARELRRRMTDAEHRLWRYLRRHFLGVHFRRQVPIGPYIVDFASTRRKLVLEIDGGQHLENQGDEVRDLWLGSRGFRVLRFWNHEVLKNTEGVLTAIALALEEREGGAEGEKNAEKEREP